MGNGSAPPESARGPNATPVFPDAARILGESGYPKIRPDAALRDSCENIGFPRKSQPIKTLNLAA